MYCAKGDILDLLEEQLLTQLTDDEGAGVVNDARVDKAIDDACGEIDGYLGARYPLPLATTPAIVRKCAVDIAIYNLFSRTVGAPEERRARYKDAVAILVNVSKGIISLGIGDPDGTPKPSEAPRMTGSGSVFGRDGMKGF
jgi:phage gp36-like protein